MSSQTERVLVLDLGAQYSRLIARRVRESGVYSEIVSPEISAARVKEKKPAGIIFSGGPASVYSPDALQTDPEILTLGIPVLGICYGHQLLAQQLGGEVAHTGQGEYGGVELSHQGDSQLLSDQPSSNVWMSHQDSVTVPPPGFTVTAETKGARVAAMEDPVRRLYGVQFHPEVVHTQEREGIFRRFLFQVCGVAGNWNPTSIIQRSLERVREQVGEEKVICALSGGVDSAVAAALVHRAVGDNLTCIFVDNGLLRTGETQQVEAAFRDSFSVSLVTVDAADRFLAALQGVLDPEEKRKIVGETFVRVFEEFASQTEARFLVQGTLYPDVIESGIGEAARIKSHHNVGGLPADMNFELVEPLRDLFKDEVRRVGEQLGLPPQIVWRQPFPGPGLSVRIVGEVTPERLVILRAADQIVTEEIESAGLDKEIWQAFAVLPAIRSVGVQGDGRTYSYPVVVRAVSSDDAMTADWVRLPWEVLAVISNRVINEVRGVNRVVYDVSSKPPATIEWE